MIKVCGITWQPDADAAVDGGATALGFNFYFPSPRYVLPEAAAAIDSKGAMRVGVFVNEDPERIEEIAAIARLDVAQLHGDEVPDDYPFTVPVWKAARVDAKFCFADYATLPVEAILLDGPAADLYGGTGKTFDWEIAALLSQNIIIAGGLDASNVAAAVAMARPWGVDACSRLETTPGKKDHKKMYEFLQAARVALSA